MSYSSWWIDKLWTLIPASAIVGEFIQTFKEYPPSQPGGTFAVDEALKMIEDGASGGGK
jgi:arylsulfatase